MSKDSHFTGQPVYSQVLNLHWLLDFISLVQQNGVT